MKKKILFMSDDLGCGGSEQSLVSLLSTLDYSKIDVDLLLRNRNGVFERYVPKEVNIIDFDYASNHPFFLWLEQKLYSLDFRYIHKHQHLAEILWDHIGKWCGILPKQYDVAISFQQGFPTFYISTKVMAKKKATRVNIDLVHANYNEDFCRRYYDRFDNVIAISNAIHDQLLNTNYVTDKSKVFTLFNVFSVDLIRQLALEKGYEDSYTGLRIATTGRLVKQKGYDLAIEAAAILKENGYKFKWYFIGEGSERASLEQQIKAHGLEETVVLLGMQPNPYPFIKGCDIYVQTSLFEGFGRTVTEAKILGKPLVSTDFPSIYDQIVDKQNGLVCRMEADSIAKSIKTLIEDEGLRKKLADNLEKENFTTAQSESAKMMEYLLSD